MRHLGRQQFDETLCLQFPGNLVQEEWSWCTECWTFLQLLKLSYCKTDCPPAAFTTAVSNKGCQPKLLSNSKFLYEQRLNSPSCLLKVLFEITHTVIIITYNNCIGIRRITKENYNNNYKPLQLGNKLPKSNSVTTCIYQMHEQYHYNGF